VEREESGAAGNLESASVGTLQSYGNTAKSQTLCVEKEASKAGSCVPVCTKCCAVVPLFHGLLPRANRCSGTSRALRGLCGTARLQPATPSLGSRV
jgi:hypothetical protein